MEASEPSAAPPVATSNPMSMAVSTTKSITFAPCRPSANAPALSDLPSVSNRALMSNRPANALSPVTWYTAAHTKLVSCNHGAGGENWLPVTKPSTNAAYCRDASWKIPPRVQRLDVHVPRPRVERRLPQLLHLVDVVPADLTLRQKHRAQPSHIAQVPRE